MTTGRKASRLMSMMIAVAVAITMVATVAPTEVSAKSKVKAPSKVSVTSTYRSGSYAVVKWKKLKKSPSGYAVYQKTGSGNWKLVKRVSKKTTSVKLSAANSAKHQFKVRAYKTYKVKKYYNKKTKKYVSKKAYNKLSKKYRTTKKVTAYKYGSYSSTKTINAIFSGTISGFKGSFNSDEDVVLTWNKLSGAKAYEVYRADGSSSYKKIASVTTNTYTDKYYNPTDTISYKVHPINGSYTGSYSSVVKLRPQDITIKEYKTVTAIYCSVCGEDVTQLTDEELQEKHGTTYYCSVCGKDVLASHSIDVIEQHIAEKHSSQTSGEGEEGTESESEGGESTVETSENQGAVTDNGTFEVGDAVVVSTDTGVNTYENGTEEIVTAHKHSWTLADVQESVTVGYTTTTVSRDICFACGEDVTNLNEEEEYSHYKKDEAAGYSHLGSTYTKEVEVQIPVYKVVTNTIATCDGCSATRTVK